MALHRVKCPLCQNIFCGGCYSEPYHLGKSCDEHKQYRESQKCRFCGGAIPNVDPAEGALANVCDSQDCLSLKELSCNKVHECGHACLGVKDEAECLPCLNEECVGPGAEQNEESYCVICYTTGLNSEPCVRLSSCGHAFHYNCLAKLIKDKWPSPRIVFKFLYCPIDTCRK